MALPLLRVAEALERILAEFQPLPIETISLHDARGRVLAEDVQAEENIPPFANSSMDGYAVRAQEVSAAPVLMRVSGDIPAGAQTVSPLTPNTIMRIMTGAPMPEGADAVVPVEDTDDPRNGVIPTQVKINRAPQVGDSVRPIGQDIQAGDMPLTAGTILKPAAIGVLAALGKAQVKVYRQPLVAVLSTGDELCHVEEIPRLWQIRDTNGETIPALAETYGARVLRLGIARDRAEDVRAKLLTAVNAQADVILSSAGVSVGAYDVVKDVVASEGALNFWRVQMRPGKPLAFGQIRGIPFVGLPGNPVSAMVTFEVFVRPILLKLGGHQNLAKPSLTVEMQTPLHSDGRESYLRVVVERHGAKYVAHSTGDQGSAIITSLVKANALAIIPAGVTEVKAGEMVEAWWLE
jgi:molybdopterin molybdotransferase